VPTFAEQGVKGYDVTGWYGLCTQSRVPAAILAKINADVNRLLTGPALVKRLQDQAVTVHTATPEAFQAHVEAEIEKWTKVVTDAHLQGD
jgi:tripartite-type tricarboxylate transporter receptor subunit TctC